MVLKLGGIGLIKFNIFFQNFNLNNIINFIILRITIVGRIIIAFHCSRQTDSKVVVALSSIVHMGAVFLLYTFSASLRLESMYLIIISHGFVSPLIFFFLRGIYDTTLRRSLILSRGLLKNLNYLSLI